jgi:hypothetical protein
MHQWATGRSPLPDYAVARLRDIWKEALFFRQAEIAARKREFDAIIEQEYMLIRWGRACLDQLSLADPLSQPDSILLAGKIRSRRRRQEAALRAAALPEPSANLQAFLDRAQVASPPDIPTAPHLASPDDTVTAPPAPQPARVAAPRSNTPPSLADLFGASPRKS